MPSLPDQAVLPQLMRKGHKIRAMLDDNLDYAQIELFYAWHYLLFDNDPPDDEPENQSGGSEDGGP